MVVSKVGGKRTNKKVNDSQKRVTFRGVKMYVRIVIPEGENVWECVCVCVSGVRPGGRETCREIPVSPDLYQ